MRLSRLAFACAAFGSVLSWGAAVEAALAYELRITRQNVNYGFSPPLPIFTLRNTSTPATNQPPIVAFQFTVGHHSVANFQETFARFEGSGNVQPFDFFPKGALSSPSSRRNDFLAFFDPVKSNRRNRLGRTTGVPGRVFQRRLDLDYDDPDERARRDRDFDRTFFNNGSAPNSVATVVFQVMPNVFRQISITLNQRPQNLASYTFTASGNGSPITTIGGMNIASKLASAPAGAAALVPESASLTLAGDPAGATAGSGTLAAVPLPPGAPAGLAVLVALGGVIEWRRRRGRA